MQTDNLNRRHVLQPFYLIIIILFLTQCSASKDLSVNVVTGKYRQIGEHGERAEFTIKADQTFTYFWQRGLNSGMTTGVWEVKEDSLILNSERQPGYSTDSFVFTQNAKTDESQYEIKLLDEMDYPLIYANCMLMNEMELIANSTANENGVCYLPQGLNANKIEIQYIGYEKARIYTQELESNSFTLKMKEPKNEKYEDFTRKPYLLKRRSLIEINKETGRISSGIYEKRK